MVFSDIERKVSTYYSEKIQTYGPSPGGVDWNSAESQQLRFKQLLKIVSTPHEHFSVLDYGCGFGSLHEFMNTIYPDYHFTGYDFTQSMIEQATKLHPTANARWESSLDQVGKHDYAIASGIFNVKLDISAAEWEEYILHHLQRMDSYSKKGFSFNLLSTYSDANHRKDHLYYADPAFVLDYCVSRFSKYVALLHDYPLYEFTILIRKTI